MVYGRPNGLTDTTKQSRHLTFQFHLHTYFMDDPHYFNLFATQIHKLITNLENWQIFSSVCLIYCYIPFPYLLLSYHKQNYHIALQNSIIPGFVY